MLPELLAAWMALQTQNPLEALADRALRDGRVSGGEIALSVSSASAGRVLYERVPEKPLLPASNTKLFTTAAALGLLGPRYRFQTLATLQGAELHVFGSGDPTLSGRFLDGDPTAVFKKWAGDLAQAGIAKLDAVVLHAGLFDRTYLHPAWIEAEYDQDAWWCAPVGALSLNDNCVDLTYAPGEKAGDPVRITVSPETAYVTVTNKAVTVKGDPKPFGFVRRDGSNEIVVRGELSADSPPRVARVAIEDPTLFFGTVLKESLERSGIQVGGIREDDAPFRLGPGVRLLSVHEGELAPILRACNGVSQNLYAELLCKKLGALYRNEGSTRAGVAVVLEYLEQHVGLKDVVLEDGSGLSRGNRASAASVRRLLEFMRKHKDGRVFVESLAVSGTEPGTLARRMKGLKGAVRAKTGHIRGVSALSGYLETASGDTLTFSILCNEWKSGSADLFQNKFLEYLHGYRGD